MGHDADSARAEARDEERTRSQRHRRRRGGFGAKVGAAVREVVIVLAMALALSFIVKTFLVQAFFIPSESMQDTLLVGDRVVVSKLTPGPFELERGDIVVFEDPGGWLSPSPEEDRGPVLGGLHDALVFVGLLPDTSEGHLIKRVIGLPGDKVQCCDSQGRLLINGEPVEEPYLKPGVEPSTKEFNITVPRGHVWVMGDNRANSSDSRFHDGPDNTGTNGSVPIDLVVGRAFAIVWPPARWGTRGVDPEAFSAVPDPGGRALAPAAAGTGVP